jgi:hypothetical protein
MPILSNSSKAATLAVACLFALANASAQTIAQTVTKWGLIGTWAFDCSVPPSKGQPRLIFEIASDGRVVHRREYSDASDEHEILSAKLSDDGTLNLRVRFAEIREFGLVKQSDGTIRSIYNHNDKNEFSIKDGIFTANGNPTPSARRCG